MSRFLSYFAKYIIQARSRQRLLLIAALGLVLSSMSLIVLKSVMGGLQKSLIDRSKMMKGLARVSLRNIETQNQDKFFKSLSQDQDLVFTPIVQVELLLRNKGYLAPTLVQGIHPSFTPSFMRDTQNQGIVLGGALAQKLRAIFDESLQLISPSHVDAFLGDIPRQVTVELSDIISSEVAEVDEFYAWVRGSLVQNLIRKRGFEEILFYPSQKLAEATYRGKIAKIAKELETEPIFWEKEHASLSWALNLEEKVMLFLFIAMTFLVGMAITSGQMIFFTRMRRDLLSFWILGMSQEKILKLMRIFSILMSFLSICIGVIIGLGFIYLLQNYGHHLMPDIFVDRTVPVELTSQGVLLAFFVPGFTSFIFTELSLYNFKNENSSFLPLLRGNTQ